MTASDTTSISTEKDYGETVDDRGTPEDLIRELQKANGGLFTTDPCSGAEPRPIAETRWTVGDNGLAQDWEGSVFVNPPYSEMDDWVDKVLTENKRNATDYILLLCKSPRTSDWFHAAAEEAGHILVFDHRLKFHGSDDAAPFSSCILTYGDVPESVLNLLATKGTMLERDEDYDTAETQVRFVEYLDEPTADENADREELVLAQNLDDLPEIHIGDLFEIHFNTEAYGVPDELPETLECEVVTGRVPEQSMSETETGTIEGVREPTVADQIELLTYNSEMEMWVMLQSRVEDDGFAVSISEGGTGIGWRPTPVSRVRCFWRSDFDFVEKSEALDVEFPSPFTAARG